MGIHKAAAVSDGGSVRPRRAKRDPPPRCTCCCAEIDIEIQIRGGGGGGAKRKRKKHFLTACSSSSSSASAAAVAPQAQALFWGAKRKRATIALLLVGPSRRRPLVDNNRIDASGSRDWANLGDGPAGLIADLALARDVADYIRFRAVCRPWRRCSPEPAGDLLDARFLPREWIMLDKPRTSTSIRFLNISTGECIRMDLPELAVDQHTLLGLTPEGLLLLFHEPSLLLRLLNPLTRRLTDLPPFTALLTSGHRDLMFWGQQLAPHLMVDCAGLIQLDDDASTVAVVVYFSAPRVLAIAKPGDESWTVVNVEDRILRFSSTLAFAGRFYCATHRGVMELNITSDHKPPQLVMVAKPMSPLRFNAMRSSLHLIDNGGDLILVHRKLCYHDNYAHDVQLDANGSVDDYKYEVFKVDLDAGIFIPVMGFNGRALFMGMTRAISVSAKVFPSLNADTLYLGFDCDEKSTIDGCSLAGGNNPRHYDPWHPCTVADCLSDCVTL